MHRPDTGGQFIYTVKYAELMNYTYVCMTLGYMIRWQGLQEKTHNVDDLKSTPLLSLSKNERITVSSLSWNENESKRVQKWTKERLEGVAYCYFGREVHLFPISSQDDL